MTFLSIRSLTGYQVLLINNLFLSLREDRDSVMCHCLRACLHLTNKGERVREKVTITHAKDKFCCKSRKICLNRF